VETREEDGKKINIFTRGGTKTRDDAAKQNKDLHHWIRKNTTSKHKFDACEEKETFKEVRHDILKENIASTLRKKVNR